MTYDDNSKAPEDSLAQSRVSNSYQYSNNDKCSYEYADDGDVHGATVKERATFEERATVEKGAPLHKAIVDEGATMEEVAAVDEYESVSVTSLEVYDFTPQSAKGEDYDYETPFWSPADKKTDLLAQFKKLRIPSIEEADIE